MRGITKRFPGVVANDAVDFAAARGEIHALLGENGAGKSTLMKALYGFYRPDAGEIRLHGVPRVLRSPKDALRAGLGMVFQQFMLVPSLSVVENVLLGLPSQGWRLDERAAAAQISAEAARYGMAVHPLARVWQLSVGEQQRVEILKLLARGADVLILDEPTAVLTPQETRDLFDTLRRLAAEGRTIIVITHKLSEVMAAADRVTVLRAGRLVGTTTTATTSPQALARMMVGRETFDLAERTPVEQGPIVLEVRDLWADGDRGPGALRGVSLAVHAGEIVGVAGVAGNGQRELGEVVAGLRRPTRGHVSIAGRERMNASPLDAIRAGLGHVPEDRLGTGVAPHLSVADNLVLKSYREPRFGRGPLLDHQTVDEVARELIEEYKIQTPGPEASVEALSGGNLQRLILAREISAGPRVLLAFHPTRGLDVGATEAVHRALFDQRHADVGVLLISEDLDEILQLSDRVAVLCGGQLMAIVRPEDVTVEQIGLLMGGTRLALPEETA
ncbi:MAG TPA: ABC transporter ATP-binding protein [bacterium]|nr:ABC transporter ATP-binding protein [bacterium]